MAAAPRGPRVARRFAQPVVGLLVAGSVLGVAGCGGDDDSGATATRPGALRVVGDGATSKAEPTGREPYAVTAPVDELAPGQLQTVQVTVTNPAAVPYRILELTATPGDPTAKCDGAEHLVVSGYDAEDPGSPPYVVPRRSRITIPLTVMMLDTAAHAEACEDVAIPLTVTGAAAEGGTGAESASGAAEGAATQGVATESGAPQG